MRAREAERQLMNRGFNVLGVSTSLEVAKTGFGELRAHQPGYRTITAHVRAGEVESFVVEAADESEIDYAFTSLPKAAKYAFIKEE